MRVENLFAGETALVTGAASNIGRGIAKALSAQGATVIATDIDTDRGRSLVDEIQAAGGKGEFHVSDLSLPAAPTTLLTALGPRASDVSIFVHSASPRRLEQWNVATVTEAEYDAMVNTNVRSGFFLARAIGQHMTAKTTRGRMLFITSLHAETPRNLPHYGISKAGQTMAVKELARFFAPAGIRVNAIAAGGVNLFDYDEPTKARIGASLPVGRVGTVEEFAAMTVYLASHESDFVTGQVFRLDGGLING